MGRQKGTVELALEPAQTKQACDHMKKLMPDKVSGALQVAPEKIFNEYACKSAQPQIDRVWQWFLLPKFWSAMHVTPRSWTAKPVTPRVWTQGKTLAKECLNDFVWALKPLALASPSMPLQNDSLFATLRMVVDEGEPDGKIWLMVYDLKTLMQYLSYLKKGCFWTNVPQALHAPPRLLSYLRFARKTWRKARESFKKDKTWPFWVQSEPAILELFEIMQPFAEDDIGKAWGIESQLNHEFAQLTQVCRSECQTSETFIANILLRIRSHVQRACSLQRVNLPNLLICRMGL